ncbi:Putative zn(2)-C6 fungal-type DNA-binding domain-containing protein [Septoria linicola]|uniref:Zn(2)-C6 fungal-type DNA-binding domain-containing protein n=1 Tax=Septoria linicola TaxID=215465 RepID=A0A9Q9B8Z1_9PEZI|nr:Putative zn(2)-C6 fungal-type DNA-binding domain-containing protein [Septoria linicola]
MPPRRSHLKSRHGCLTCKKRRVKCGEEHPKCNNCMSRATDCKWPDPAAITSHASSARDSSSSKSPGSTSEASTSSSATRNIAELQLMHRWSTSTFESMASEISGDREVWRVMVPETATKYDFLLNSMFALTAFEMAYKKPAESNQHISTALEYQTQAFAKFRNDLSRLVAGDAEDEAHDALLYCSILLMVLALASSTQPALRGSMIDNTIIHFELVRGVSVVMLKKPECIKAHPLVCNVPDLMSLPRGEYSERFAEAFRMLNEINEKRAPSTTSDTNEAQTDNTKDVYLACKYAIWWLEYLTATCQEMKLRGFLLAWISLAGDDFVKTLKASDHVALLALMWWGVVLNPLGYEYWYGEEYGSTLAGEVVEMLAGLPDPRFEELIRLADDEVGEGRAEAAKKPGSTIEDEEVVHRHFWEDASRLKDDGGLGNIPAEIIKYTSKQNNGFYKDDEDKRRGL